MSAEVGASAVLIVDDDPLVRELLDRWMVGGGYRAIQAEHAEAAIERLSSEPIGVAFCDQTMPGRGGEWLVEQIRERFPAVAVILATGSDVPPRVSGQAGVVGYMEKPFTRSLVLAAVGDAMVWHRVASRTR